VPSKKNKSSRQLTNKKIGQYELLNRIASGGMAEVYLAKQTKHAGFERKVCIKQILPHLCATKEFIQMFRDEARIVAHLNHPNIAQILDIGQFEERDFIAMEFVDGYDVRNIYNHQASLGRPMPQDVVAHIGLQISQGLEHAHRCKDLKGIPLNIVHRDISPQNILVSRSGYVKIIDFGVAKAANRLNETQAGVLKGKYAYMSPEQACGDPLDGRSDLFALAITLYEISTGVRVFKRDNELETLHAVIECEVTKPSKILPDFDPNFERILLKCLAPDPMNRFSSANELAEALRTSLTDMGYVISPNTLEDYLFGLRIPQLESNFNRLSINSVSETPPESPDEMEGQTTQSQKAKKDIGEEETELITKTTVSSETVRVEDFKLNMDQMTTNRTVASFPKADVNAPNPKNNRVPWLILFGLFVGLGAGVLARLSQTSPKNTAIKSGPIILETIPPGAEIHFVGPGSESYNQKYRNDKTPFLIKEGIPSEAHWALEIKLEHYQDQIISLPTITAENKPATISIPMGEKLTQAPFATVNIRSEPPGANIFVNGNWVAQKTPVENYRLSGGNPYTFFLEKEGHKPSKLRILIDRLKHKNLDFDLEPLEKNSRTKKAQESFGYLTIQGATGARLMMDGKLLGVSPIQRKVLSIGKKQIDITEAGSGLSMIRYAIIQPESTTEIEITNEPGELSVSGPSGSRFRLGKSAWRKPTNLTIQAGTYNLTYRCKGSGTFKRAAIEVESFTTNRLVLNCR